MIAYATVAIAIGVPALIGMISRGLFRRFMRRRNRKN